MCHELVVVEVDGSSAGDAALHDALSRAQTYGGSVELVTAWPSQSEEGVDQAVLYRAGHRWAVGTQRAAVERASTRTADAPSVTGAVGDDDPAELLVEVGARAACIVLGKRTDEPVGSACDSVRESCTALLKRPVVVVPDVRGGEPDWGRDAVA
jgi:hypothetical protein